MRDQGGAAAAGGGRTLRMVTYTPDPAAGVFETLLAIDGVLIELLWHRERMRAAVAELYGKRLDELPPAPAMAGWARVRFDTRPDGAGPRVTVRVGRVEPRPDLGASAPHVALEPVVMPGGWGPRKWADRAVLDELAGPGTLPLLIDAGGLVLEAGRASVFLVERGGLVTPPLDGRILPGVTRRRILSLARGMRIAAAEEPVTLERLRAATEVFVAGSIRGIEPVGGPAGECTRVMAGELDRVWRGQLEDGRDGG